MDDWVGFGSARFSSFRFFNVQCVYVCWLIARLLLPEAIRNLLLNFKIHLISGIKVTMIYKTYFVMVQKDITIISSSVVVVEDATPRTGQKKKKKSGIIRNQK